MILTYRYRIKDAGASRRRVLRSQARSVNFVWNYLCEIDRKAAMEWRAGRNIRRPTAYDLQKLCRGVTKELGIHSDTIDAICVQFNRARGGCFPNTPRFRSHKRNLDWIPWNHFTGYARVIGPRLTFMGRRYHLWLSRPIPADGKPRSWNMSCDARGRWYTNITVDLPQCEKKHGDAVGIDLGLKSLATLSTGEKIDMPAFYRRSEAKLALHQQRGQERRSRAIAAKIANQRRDYLHRVSTKIVRKNARIYIGDVSPSQIGRTCMAKATHDAGWGMLKAMLSYKAVMQGGMCETVSERWTSQACSACGVIPDSSPKGMGALGIRLWTCSDCGASHDRDVNAARNILRVGTECRPLAAGIAHIAKALTEGGGGHSTPTPGASAA